MVVLKNIFLAILITVTVSALAFLSGPRIDKEDLIIQDTVVRYHDGIYDGESQHIYKDEPYWGKVQIKIENGQFTVVRFVIRDTNLHETFNQFYEKHFEKVPEYIEQCRNDWRGVQSYPGKLLEKQNINKVDATSGATWSYNIFKASADSALKKAAIK
jgi:major membrane immunogen (membrane-anchored lipoprotein)